MPDDRRERADRILDAAADLLVNWGYPRVTIDEVARRAGIGKGTVYLHWRSRDDLLLAVMTREGGRLVAECAAGIEADPHDMLLHRYLRLIYLGTVRRPLLRAAFTGNIDMLGKLAGENVAALGREKQLLSNDFLRLLIDNELLRTEHSLDEINYAVGATVLGYLMLAGLAPEGMVLPDEQTADLLSDTLAAAFPPSRKPTRRTLDAIAPKVVERLTELMHTYEHYTYRPNGGREESR